MLLISLWLSVTVPAASPQAGVMLSLRSGVTAPMALQAAKDVGAQLEHAGVPIAGVDDGTSCRGKKVCLLARARKKAWAVVVNVEVGAVLGDGTLRVEALSVDEDGRSLALVDVDGPPAELVEKARPQLEDPLAREVKTTLGIAPAPVAETPPPVEETPTAAPEPEKVVEAPPPVEETSETSIAEEPVERPSFTGARIAGLSVAGAGVAALVTSAVFFGQAGSAGSQVTSLCPAGQQCNNPEAFTAYEKSAGAQNTAAVLAGIGGAAVAAGLVVFFLNPGGSHEPSTAAALVPVPGGVVGTVGGRF